jgi:hypothetical protein
MCSPQTSPRCIRCQGRIAPARGRRDKRRERARHDPRRPRVPLRFPHGGSRPLRRGAPAEAVPGPAYETHCETSVKGLRRPRCPHVARTLRRESIIGVECGGTDGQLPDRGLRQRSGCCDREIVDGGSAYHGPPATLRPAKTARQALVRVAEETLAPNERLARIRALARRALEDRDDREAVLERLTNRRTGCARDERQPPFGRAHASTR